MADTIALAPAAPSLSQSIGGWQGIQKNALEIQNAQAQQEAGKAYQGAINSLTGEFDPNKFRTLLAQNPAAAMAAGPALRNTQEISSDQLTQARAKVGWVNSATGSLTRLGPNITQQDAIGALHEGVTNGMLTPAEFQKEVAAVAALGNDPAKLHAWASQHQFTAMSVGQQLEQTYGTPFRENQGGAIVSGTQAPARMGGGMITAPGAIPLAPTPAQLAAPYEYKDPTTGEQKTTTLGDFLREHGLTIPGTVGAPAAAPKPVTTSPAPGMKEKWEASANQYNADNAAAGGYQARIFPLVQAASILGSGDVTTGPGAEAVNRVKEFLATRAATFGWDAQTIQQAKFDELNKYLTQYVNSQGMSASSDARLASAITGSPSAHITTMANKDVVKAMIGLERMKQMAITDFRAQGGQPNAYSDYLSNWQNTHDPRAFVVDMLDDGQRKKMLDGMTAAQKLAFSRTLDIVERNPGVMGQAAMPGH